MSRLDDAIRRLPHDQRETARRNPGAFFGPASGLPFIPPGFRLTERGMQAIPGAIDATTLAGMDDREPMRPGFVRGPLGQTLPGPGGLAAIAYLHKGKPMLPAERAEPSPEEIERWQAQYQAEYGPKEPEPEPEPEPVLAIEPEPEMRPGQGLLSGDDHGSS